VSAEDRGEKEGKEKERETRKGVMEIYDLLFTQIITSMCMFFSDDKFNSCLLKTHVTQTVSE
jgi:hypothetical protein